MASDNAIPKRSGYSATREIMERSLNAFACWNSEVGDDVDFLESDCLERLKDLAADVRDGELKAAYEPWDPFSREDLE